MTNEELAKVNDILSPADLSAFAHRLCKKNSFDPKAFYPRTVTSEVMPSVARRILYVGSTVNLLRRAIFLGATDIEVNNIAEHLMVLTDSVDDGLNYRQSYTDHGIAQLEKKYSMEEFLGLTAQIDLDELISVLKRDREYFGVKLK